MAQVAASVHPPTNLSITLHMQTRPSLLVAVVLTVHLALPCRAQEATPVNLAQQTLLQEQAMDQDLDQALAARDYDGFVGRFSRYSSAHWERALGQVAKLPAKDQAKVLAGLLRNGPIQVDEEETVVGNSESQIAQYMFQDRLVQMAYQVLGQKPPPLPGERNRYLTRKETQDLAARLQALP